MTQPTNPLSFYALRSERAAVLALAAARGLTAVSEEQPLTDYWTLTQTGAPLPPDAPALLLPLGPGDLGLDVSHWQGVIDFGKVRAAGYRFVYIKITQGVSIVDSRGAENRRKARAAGLHVGCYHFFEWDRDGGQQAMHFVAQLGELIGSLTPAVDVEPDGQRPGIDKVVSTANLLKFVQTVEAVGLRPPVVYTSQGAWDAMTTRPAWGAELPLWSADWTPPLNLPAGWTHARFWQQGKRPVDGVAEPVDWNVYQGLTPAPPPPPVGQPHTLNHLTNQAVINLFSRAFGAATYIAKLTAATDEAVVFANRTALFVGPSIEAMPGLTAAEKAALIAAL
jgi:lysozyme